MAFTCLKLFTIDHLMCEAWKKSIHLIRSRSVSIPPNPNSYIILYIILVRLGLGSFQIYGPGSCPRVVDEGLASMWGTCCGKHSIGAFMCFHVLSVFNKVQKVQRLRGRRALEARHFLVPCFSFSVSWAHLRCIQPF